MLKEEFTGTWTNKVRKVRKLMKTIVINLIGSPGTGKSTLASELFSKMKWQGYDVELVSEYAK